MVTAVILAAAIMITAANLNLEKLFLSRKRVKMVQRLITLPVTWLVVYVTDTVVSVVPIGGFPEKLSMIEDVPTEIEISEDDILFADSNNLFE